jgi:hypothetical protein
MRLLALKDKAAKALLQALRAGTASLLRAFGQVLENVAVVVFWFRQDLNGRYLCVRAAHPLLLSYISQPWRPFIGPLGQKGANEPNSMRLHGQQRVSVHSCSLLCRLSLGDCAYQ